MRNFESLSEQEVLALAIELEEEDARIYADFAEGLRENYPASAQVFEGMRQEESHHRHRLFELYKQKFGEHIPLIRRDDVRGFVKGAYAAAIGTILGASVLLGKIAIGDLLAIIIALLCLLVLFRWKVSNPLLIAATAAVGIIAFPLLNPSWVFVK